MPKLDNDNLEQHTLPTGSYGYSAVSLNELGATEYTIVTIVQDTSSSVQGFKPEMEKAIAEIVKACRFSPRADNLLIRLTTFNSNMDEIHGFKLLSECNQDDYLDCLNVGGMTALFDATENAITATTDYAKTLTENDFDVNGIIIVLTDGWDNVSKLGPANVKASIEKVMKAESVESLVTILIGVGTNYDPSISDALNNFKDEAGLTQYVEIADASAKTLAKLAEFVSQSISAQSISLGTGGPSQPLSLNI